MTTDVSVDMSAIDCIFFRLQSAAHSVQERLEHVDTEEGVIRLRPQEVRKVGKPGAVFTVGIIINRKPVHVLSETLYIMSLYVTYLWLIPFVYTGPDRVDSL